ncbi:cysteine desulfurase [Azospirillum agricola]|uniref:cysteine desulfurase family protein n=1 Tax=Azospirillum agricola TaxID=1720247 RepID=UPI001AEAA4B8|nr:cysteine desulfurase family protein [Azospirillum agricola]MBP2229027.1 cysteine desulfurase [Azospirillum agricola]
MSAIYLDHLASTPLDPQVLDAMLPWWAPGAAGNPQAAHPAGWRAADAIEEARGHIAALVGARPGAVVFTSGATEANTLALLGTLAPGAACLVSAVEHPSVLGCLPELRRRGHPTTIVPVDADGRVDPNALERALAVGAAAGTGPALVSVMAANNEVGTIQPLAGITALARRHGALVHSDAVQALGTRALDMPALGLDLLSLSGHKLNGPMGIGALLVRDGVRLAPPSAGGGQQGGRRPGTLPTALCVGLGAACRLARARAEEDGRRIAALRDRLWARLEAELSGIRRNGAANGLAGCLNVTIPGIDAADLLLGLPELALATGSACRSGDAEPSHVLLAMGRSAEDAHASLRFGLGRTTRAEEVDEAAARLVAAVRTAGGCPP